MNSKSYQPLEIKQGNEERGQNNNNCSVPPGILPGVHELIAQSQSYPSAPSFNSYGSSIAQNTHLVYSQPLHPSLQYNDGVGVSDIRYQNSSRVTSNIQYQNGFTGSNVLSNPSSVVYKGEPFVYPSSGDVRMSLVHPLQQKHEVGPSWFSSKLVQDHQVQSLSSSQWLTEAPSVNKLPSSGYGGGSVGGLQFVSTSQTHILGPIQQPEVQPTPPCFWTDHLKSQTLRPLPRPISSILERRPKPQVHHQAPGCYGSSQFKHCLCSGFSASPPNIYQKTCLSGQHVCQDSQLYNVSFVNNALMASISPQYHVASISPSQISPAGINIPVTAAAVSARECEGVSVSNNVLNIGAKGSCGKQGIQLDENCNHIYSTSINMLPIESMGRKSEYQQIEEKYEKEQETSLEEENLSASAIEKYIQSAPDFQSLSQIHTDQMETDTPKIGYSASTSISGQDCLSVGKNVQDIGGIQISEKQNPQLVGNRHTNVSPQTVGVSSEGVHSTESQADGERKDPALKMSFAKTKRKFKRGFSQLDNLANRLERNSMIGIRNRSKDSRIVVSCSSSSSEISPVTGDQGSPSTIETIGRRRSYRSRNFSKEFFNKWSIFEDVPLVISRQPDPGIVCSTPKQQHTDDETDNGFSCDTCRKSFFSHYSYTRHMKKHKISNENCQRKVVKPRDIYRCSPCNMTWANHDQFVFHSRCHMSKGMQSLIEDDEECRPKLDDFGQDSVSEGKEQMFNKTSSKRYICTICGDSLLSSFEYNLHCSKHGRTDDVMSSNESDSSFSSPRYFHCGVCDVKFVNRFMYSKHCVSEKHRTNQKVKGSGIPESDVSDAKELGKQTQDQAIDTFQSSSGLSGSSGNEPQNRFVMEDPNPVIHPGKRNDVQSGLSDKSAEELLEVKRSLTIKPDADLLVPHGIPTSVNYSVSSSDNIKPIKCPHEQQSLKKSSNPAVNCRFLYLRAKPKSDKPCISSQHIGTRYSEGVEQDNFVCSKSEGSVDVSDPSVSDTCQVSSGNRATHQGLKESLDENNNPTDFPRCSEHLLSDRCVPTCNTVSSLYNNFTVGLNSVESSIIESSEDAGYTGKQVKVSYNKCSVNETLVLDHHPPVSTVAFQKQKTPNMSLVADVSNISQLKPSENGSQVNGLEVPTDDSGLETSGEMLFDGKYSEGWSIGSSRTDPDNTPIVVCDRHPVSSGLNLKGGVMLNKTSSGQDDAVPLKGDSGLWSDEEMETCESDVEENMQEASQRQDCLEDSSRRKATKDDDHVDLLEENALKDWGIESVDISARSEMDASGIESRLTGVKDVIAVEIKYDANVNSLDLGESVEIVATSDLKHLSELDLQTTTDLMEKQILPHNQNITADAINSNLSTEDKIRSGNKESNKNYNFDQPQVFHRTRRAKQSRPALLLDGDFHNGKIYFCEVCGETFLNPFRYSAHYKKRAHMELASQHGYGNILGVGTNVSKKIREKGQNSETQDDFKRMKVLKVKKSGRIFGKRRRKRRKSLIQRAPSTNVNVTSTSQLGKNEKQYPLSKLHKVSPLQISQADCRKVERRWSDRIPKPSRLKKMASSNKLKKLKSRLIHSSRHYNLRIVKHSEKMIASGIKKYCKKNNLSCSCCSLVFPSQQDLRLHVCSERLGDTSVNNKTESVSRSDNDNDVKRVDTEKPCFEDGQLDEQPLKKRKPVVKCPALFKMLTAAKELQTNKSRASDAQKHIQKSDKRRLGASKRRKLSTKNKNKNKSVNSKSSMADSFKSVSKQRKCDSKIPNRTKSLPFAKKPKTLSSLVCHDKDMDNSEQEKAVKSGNSKPLEFCEVCEKFYSSKSHLYRHFKTIVHKRHLQAKKKKRKNDVV